MDKNKFNLNRIKFSLGPIGICVSFFATGLGLVIISCMEFEHSLWTSFGKNITNGLGTTLIASAIVSLVLEMSNIQSILSKALSNILSEDFPFDAYSTQNLEEFNKQIVSHLCDDNVRAEQLNNGIYYLYEKKLREKITAVYYEFHNCKYYITPDSESELFSVRAEIIYKKQNKFAKENIMKFKIKTYSLNGENAETNKQNNFLVDAFEINGVPEPPDCFVPEDIQPKKYAKYYDCKIKAEKNLGKQKECVIKLIYEYNIPMHDKMQSYKLTEPCKRLNHEFKIYPDKATRKEWGLRATAFNTFYNNQKTEDAKYKVDMQTDDNIKIVFDDWVLPGAGYVVTYYEKNEK